MPKKTLKNTNQADQKSSVSEEEELKNPLSGDLGVLSDVLEQSISSSLGLNLSSLMEHPLAVRAFSIIDSLPPGINGIIQKFSKFPSRLRQSTR